MSPPPDDAEVEVRIEDPAELRRRRRFERATTQLAIFGIVVGLLSRTCHRDAVIRPGVTITVLDAQGHPVAGADVVLGHVTYPYGALRDWWTLTTDAAGTVHTTELRRGEVTAWMCMHGVTEHHHLVCAGKLGAGVALVRDVGDDDHLVLRLHDDYADDCHDAEVLRRRDELDTTQLARLRANRRSDSHLGAASEAAPR